MKRFVADVGNKVIRVSFVDADAEVTTARLRGETLLE